MTRDKGVIDLKFISSVIFFNPIKYTAANSLTIDPPFGTD